MAVKEVRYLADVVIRARLLPRCRRALPSTAATGGGYDCLIDLGRGRTLVGLGGQVYTHFAHRGGLDDARLQAVFGVFRA